MKTLECVAVSGLLLLASLVTCDQLNPQPFDIIYYLFTRANRLTGEVISYNDPVISPFYKGSNNTIVVLHGYGSTFSSSQWMTTLKDVILKREDSNVICVDWSILSAMPDYNASATNARYAGKQIALFLTDLQERGGLSPSRVHLIGYSLGAQVVGIAGHHFPNTDRITGLDPARPFFENVPEEERLDASDAKFVVIHHTNAGILITGHFGFYKPIGHVDIYPNGGRDQKGCNYYLEEIVENMKKGTPDQIEDCSHDRAPAYLITSVIRNDFVVYQCSDYKTYLTGSCNNITNTMGWGADRTKPGLFYIDTLTDQPYVAAQIRADIVLGPTTVNGNFFIRVQAPGLNEDEIRLFNATQDIVGNSVFKRILTAPLETGVTGVIIELEYVASNIGPPQLEIISMKTEDIATGEKSCIGANILLQSRMPQIFLPSSGEC